MNKPAVPDLSKSLDQYYTDPKFAKEFMQNIQDTVDLNAADVLPAKF